MSRTRNPKLYMALYVVICDYLEKNGRFPSLRELVNETRYETTSAVAFQMQNLINVGLIKATRSTKSNSRKFSVVGGAWTPPPMYWESRFILDGTCIPGR